MGIRNCTMITNKLTIMLATAIYILTSFHVGMLFDCIQGQAVLKEF